MKYLKSIQSVKTPSESLDGTIDIDVTPVMNMFIILIPFLVSVAVFTHLSILEFSLPPNVGTGLANQKEKPKLKITVIITKEYLGITHGAIMLDSLPLVDENYNYEKLEVQLKTHRNDEKIEIKNELIVAVRDNIQFKHVVTVMDRCREAGFEKIGLSSATENPEEDK